MPFIHRKAVINDANVDITAQ